MTIRSLRTFAVLLVMVLMTACASKPPEAATMKGQVIAAQAINPDRRGESRPVVVRIFQLKTGGTFDSADFYSLYNDAAAVLAADLLFTREIVVQPGVTEKFEAEFDPDTRVIGVMAAFRDIENAQWRSKVELPEEKLIKLLDRRQMLVNLDDRTVTLTFAKPPKK